MNLFYINVDNGRYFLTGEEARHCRKVLRLKSGDKLAGTDGKGNFFEARITSGDEEKIYVNVENLIPRFGEKKQEIFVAISLLHKPDRFEWFVEKSVELGVTKIIPFISKNTVKTGFRSDRMEKIMIAAIKQCFRTQLPEISEPVLLRELPQLISAEVQFIAHAGAEKNISAYREEIFPAGSVCCIIGPEGDFAADEIEKMVKAGFTPVHFGENRLRSETAAIHFLSVVKSFMAY